jgi:uncharacterized membrane protein
MTPISAFLSIFCLFIGAFCVGFGIDQIVNDYRDNKRYWEYVLNNIDSFKYICSKYNDQDKRYLFKSELFYLLIGKDCSGITHVSDYECLATDLYCKKYVEQVKEKLAEKYNIDFGF